MKPSREIKTARVSATLVLFFFLYLFLPIKLTESPAKLFLFYAILITLTVYIWLRSLRNINLIKIDEQDIIEKINLLKDENIKSLKVKNGFREKEERYSKLRQIVEDLNNDLDLELLAGKLTAITFSLISREKGNALFYLADNKKQSISLFCTKKDIEAEVIKLKTGDIFDDWVLKHTQPLLIEDASRDFRFDISKRDLGRRKVSSLISAPLISENNLLGILRLESREPFFFTQDDLRLLVSISDIAAVAVENTQLFQRTKELAIHDGLTSLYTKGYFTERLKEECKRALREGGTLSLVMIDIDNFKKYNDKYGHTAGDIVLKKLSLIMKDSFKDINCIISRFGGEEFCVILPDMDIEKASFAAEALLHKVESYRLVLRKQETKITVSAGVATFLKDAKEDDELILNADQALYKAKQSGRNRVVCA